MPNTTTTSTPKYSFKTIAEAVKHFGGEANLLEAISSHATNQAARTKYNADKNELYRVAKQLLKDGKISIPAKG